MRCVKNTGAPGCGAARAPSAARPWLRLLLLLALGLHASGCATEAAHPPAAGPSASPSSEPAAHHVWRRSTPEAQGVDSRDLTRVLERVTTQGIALHGLLVYRNGHVILEVYPAPYDAETPHNIKSVSKSLLSALVGIAIEQEFLADIDQPVSEFFPESFRAEPDPTKHDLSLRHLLTMTAGLDLDENGPKMKALFSNDDWIGATLQRPMVAAPGERFTYSSALTHLMSGVLTRASQRSLLALCEQYLCGPLGFGELAWSTDPSGYHFGGAELYLKPRDILKLGVLYLNEGRWGHQQLVPANWVRASTRNQLGRAPSEHPYGFWWWPVKNGYMATGWGGQRLLVVPEQQLVIAATFADDDGLERLFGDFAEDSLASAPLPPNPSAVSSLRATVLALEQPPTRPVEPLPPVALAISGRSFVIHGEGEASPLSGLSLDFSRPDAYGLTLRWGETSRRLALGLDGRFRLTGPDVPPTHDKQVRLTGRFDGETALRGRWVDANTLELEFVPMGEPARLDLTLGFHDGQVLINARTRPGHREWRLVGTLSNPDRDEDAAAPETKKRPT